MAWRIETGPIKKEIGEVGEETKKKQFHPPRGKETRDEEDILAVMCLSSKRISG
jgi:hypothetical protein